MEASTAIPNPGDLDVRSNIVIGARFPDYELSDWRDLREITRAIRPDWDLGIAGMRERWDAGTRDDFWPYGRSMREVLSARDSGGGQ